MADFEHDRSGLASRAGVPVRSAPASLDINRVQHRRGRWRVCDRGQDRIARRSATEAAAILDACRTLQLADASALATGRALLLRIVAMLTAMVVKLGESGSGSGSGSGSTADH